MVPYTIGIAHIFLLVLFVIGSPKVICFAEILTSLISCFFRILWWVNMVLHNTDAKHIHKESIDVFQWLEFENSHISDKLVWHGLMIRFIVVRKVCLKNHNRMTITGPSGIWVRVIHYTVSNLCCKFPLNFLLFLYLSGHSVDIPTKVFCWR